jgi:hypothetical protein
MKQFILAGVVLSTALGLAQNSAIEVKGGFQFPESILVDAVGDQYFVSNINGSLSPKDNNGFISRVAPDGTILELKWLEGGKNGVRLSDPKGMALVGGSLYVTDVDTVQVFDIKSKRQIGSIQFAGSTYLNDATSDLLGNVYVSDSGFNPDFSPSGTAAVYKINRQRKIETLAKGANLAFPNGLSVVGNTVYVAPAGGNEVYTLNADGKQSGVVKLPGGGLDGIEWFNGAWYVSSLETSSVYKIQNGTVSVAAEKIPTPADIAIDKKRGHLLIPVLTENRLVFQPL